MKGRTLTFLGILAAIVGAALLIFHKTITTHTIVLVAAILFIAVGFINVLMVSYSKNMHALGRSLVQVANIAAIVLGVCLLFFKGTFAPYVTWVFGILVAFCSLWQFYTLAISIRPVTLPAWHYVFPLVLAGAAVYILTRDIGGDVQEKDRLVMLATGVSMAVLAVACLIEGSTLGVKHRKIRREQQIAQNAATEASAAQAEAEAKKAVAEAQTAQKAQNQQEITENLDDPSKIDNEKVEK